MTLLRQCLFELRSRRGIDSDDTAAMHPHQIAAVGRAASAVVNKDPEVSIIGVADCGLEPDPFVAIPELQGSP